MFLWKNMQKKLMLGISSNGSQHILIEPAICPSGVHASNLSA